MPIRLTATCIGSLASEILKEDRTTVGTVTHTFPNSFYTRTLDDELLFVTNRPLKSPVTVNVDSSFDLQQLIKPQDQMTVHGTEVTVGTDVSIDVRDVSTYAPHINLATKDLQLEQVEKALHLFALILNVIDTRNSILDKGGLAHSTASEFVVRGIIPFRSSPVNEISEIQNLVGLGSGFTPSGDDLLGGFLALYNSFAEKLGHRQVLLNFESLKKKTNWISAKLLDYMQRLILDEQMARIAGAALSGDGDKLVLALETILPRGHTSGIDIAVGAILGLGLVYDLALGTKETEILTDELGLSMSPSRAEFPLNA